MKKLLSLLLTGLMLAGLAACGGEATTSVPPPEEGGSSATTAPAATGDTPVLRLALSQGPHTDDLVNFLPAFEAQENVKVEYEIIAESGYVQKLMLGLSGDKPEYDVFMSSNSMWGQLLDSGWVYPLNDLIADPALTDQAWLDGFSDSMLDVVNRDGERYAVVYQMGTNILYYNKDLFEKAGLDPNDPPTTLAGVLEAAKQLHDPANDQYGISFRGSREQNINTFFWVMLWFSLGGDWYDVPGAPDIAVLDRPEAVEATEFYAEFAKYAPQGIANYTFEDAMLAMQQGKVGMWIDTSILAGNVLDPENSLVSDVVGFAGFTEGKSIGAPWCFQIAAATEYPEEAWKLMQYITGFEVQWAQTKSGMQTSPVRTDILSHPEINDYMNEELAAALQQGLSSAAPVYFPTISQTQEIRSVLSIAINDVAAGTVDAETAMKETNDEVIKILERDGLM